MTWLEYGGKFFIRKHGRSWWVTQATMFWGTHATWASALRGVLSVMNESAGVSLTGQGTR